MLPSYQSVPSKTSREPWLSTTVHTWVEGPDGPIEDDRSRQSWYSRRVLDWWLWELSACVLSPLALVASIAILAAYSGGRAPELPKNFTLNAIISILTNVVKASILFVVAASISQLKWLWLKDTRSLQDLQVFDDASRGPLGALYIIFFLRGRHLASLGALITILTLVLDPFMQQIIVYPVGVVYRESGEASVARTDNVTYAAQGQKGRRMDSVLDQGIMNAIYNGDSAPTLKPSCPTGNCTWPIFHSIGVCSRCIDMADKVTLEGACTPGDFLEMEKNCTISFQHGVPIVNPYDGVGAASYIAWLLNYKPDHGNTFSAVTKQIKGNFAGLDNPLFALGWVEIDYSTLKNTTPIARAMECMVTYCLERHNVSVQAGVSIKSTEPVHLASMDQLSGWDITETLLPADEMVRVINFVVDSNAGHALWKRLILNLLGNATTWPVSTEYFIPSNTFIGIARTIDDKMHMIETVARSLTDSILQPSNQTMTGVVGVPEQFIHVRWGWIALPTFIVLTTMLFLFLVMLGTKAHDVEVWKSSSLALLYHGLEKPNEDNAHFSRVSDMTQHAANVRVRLATSEADTWELQVDEGDDVNRRG
ncbi:hypothetical protein AJ78_05822 [Emergomyces pasteurianus Ep9510]|uniref:Uncharacterized protein n=1 Tax=Emergomyces pasteurianus Ep9510 TaxID=1447872 RepID=A0A1J9Q0P9_9EURO|nr:hypothetical protein AJ78_05822 [Emergomyces pasteurianus Ep9510]